MKKISDLSFQPVSQDDKILSGKELTSLVEQLDNWELADYGGSKALYKSFRVQNFIDAQNLACITGELAEKFNHHPILSYTWGKLEVYWFTHSLKGVHKNDIVLAAKTEQAAQDSKLLLG